MAAPAVVFDRIWKKFRRGEVHDSLRDLIPAVLRGFTAQSSELTGTEFWALRDVSFELEAGEGLAIIGPNGAGKSTALKMLTRLLKPTSGRCSVRGRVGSLIEVAAGFHPDLTGRENVFLQGAILGMKRREIQQKFDAIVEFAGAEAFLDTPVKRYSSGMNARLGFAVAAHLDPDVLIVDEILSVGDMAFQQRCIDRMAQFRASGTAVVFVSHNLHAVATYFEKGLVLDKGTAIFQGAAPDAVARYSARVGSTVPGEKRSGRGRVASAQLLRQGAPISVANPGESLDLLVRYEHSGDASERLLFGFYLTHAETGLRLYNGNVRDLGLQGPLADTAGVLTVRFALRANVLRGSYYFSCYVSDLITHEVIDRLEPAATLVVHETTSMQGFVNLDVRVTREELPALCNGRRV